MQAASVLEHQRAVFGLVDQGSTSPFAKVVFHLPVTPFDPALAKSGRDAPRVVGVIVVVAAAGVDGLEIVIVVVIRGPEPPPHRQQQIYRSTPKRPAYRGPFARTFTAPFNSSFSLSIRSPRLWAILSSFSTAFRESTVAPLEFVNAPSGFWFITS